jgi:hypothetical protein
MHVKGPGCGRQAGKTSSCTSGFVFNAVSLNHSIPRTKFFPNLLFGNDNVFFLSFWLISEIHGWKDWLGSHFFDASRIEKVFPQLPTSPSIHPCHLPLSCRLKAITTKQERRQRKQASSERKRERCWKHENQKERKREHFVQTATIKPRFTMTHGTPTDNPGPDQHRTLDRSTPPPKEKRKNTWIINNNNKKTHSKEGRVPWVPKSGGGGIPHRTVNKQASRRRQERWHTPSNQEQESL